MKIINKKNLIVGVTLSLALAVGVIIGPTSDTKATNSNPINPIFTSNKDKSANSLISKDEILNIVARYQAKTNESYIKSAKLKTYKNHMKEDEPDNDEINYQIDPNRMVWVIVTEYPDGLETKMGFFSKATLT